MKILEFILWVILTAIAIYIVEFFNPFALGLMAVVLVFILIISLKEDERDKQN